MGELLDSMGDVSGDCPKGSKFVVNCDDDNFSARTPSKFPEKEKADTVIVCNIFFWIFTLLSLLSLLLVLECMYFVEKVKISFDGLPKVKVKEMVNR